jgi:hypothetical protein
MSFLRTCAVSALLVPVLSVLAADKSSQVTPTSLVNQAIPTYGVVNQVPHYTDSRANALYLEIHQVLADVESSVMAGKIISPPPVDPQKIKKNEVAQPSAAFGDVRLKDLLSRLIELDARITYRTHVEQWHIDNSFSALARAAEMQAMSGYVTTETAAAVQNARTKAATEAKAQEPRQQMKPKPKMEAPKAEKPALAPVEPAPAIEAPDLTPPPEQ